MTEPRRGRKCSGGRRVAESDAWVGTSCGASAWPTLVPVGPVAVLAVDGPVMRERVALGLWHGITCGA